MTRGTVESAALRGCCRVYDALDKRNLLNTLYTTLANEAEHEKSLRLEWIVIILIAIEIVMGFSEKLLPWLHGR